MALQRAESVQATMPKGSVLVWTGWTAHGAGANRTDARRRSMNIDYVLSFLQAEENQFLACPPHLARDCPEELQALMGYQLGYQTGGPVSLFGTFAEVLCADVAMRPG